MATRFIPRTVFPEYRVNLSDFKGHHVKALGRMKDLAPQIDLILELRDARAPLSTANDLLTKSLYDKDRLILYTKRDLSSVSPQYLNMLHQADNEKWQFVDCRSRQDTSRILKAVREKHDLMYPRPPLGLRMLVVGMPNVGKSTLVNSLRSYGLNRKKKAVAKTGGQAGVTRNTSEIIRVSEDPDVLLYDTPGVLVPKVADCKTMLSLSLTGTISTANQIDPVITADYMLYIMNLTDPTRYSRWLKEPTNDIYKLLDSIARQTHNVRRLKGQKKPTPNYVGAAIELLQHVQMGKLGKWCFDEAALLNEVPSQSSDQSHTQTSKFY